MAYIFITLPDNTKVRVKEGITAYKLAEKISLELAKKAIAAKVDNKLVDLSFPIEKDSKYKAITMSDPEALEILRHSTAHVLAQAVVSLFPKALPTIGPVIKDGFYYDFDIKHAFTPEDLKKIERRMQEIIDADLEIKRIELTKAKAKRLFKDNPYKLELIEEFGKQLSAYQQGDFVDLCKGPHLPRTGLIKAFRLTKVAAAYWRGDPSKPQLQRIYGTAFQNKKQLNRFLKKLEEAKKRDHVMLGKQLGIFSISPEIGAGLVLWHPHGSIIRTIIEDFWRKEHEKHGYHYIYTPHIGHLDLWKKSGHWSFYRESMYSPMKIDSVEYLLKPMNCPFHVHIYKSRTRSYRELPIRYCELGTVYRYERSGVLHGLVRVRGFTQDDAHIFCTPEQLEDELVEVLKLSLYMLRTFGFERFVIELSVRDPEHKEKYLGSDEIWKKAETALKNALRRKGLNYKIGIGEAKFYGPAIDIKLLDALGREWQGPTIQVDFNFPEKFNLSYEGKDGRKHRPVMIHRTVLGSMERFIGCLIEHYSGKFPLWLSPIQVRILTVADRFVDYANSIAETMRKSGLRVEVDSRSESINYKVRQAQLDKVNYILVVGEREQKNKTVSVRTRDNIVHGQQKLNKFIQELVEIIAEKRL